VDVDRTDTVGGAAWNLKKLFLLHMRKKIAVDGAAKKCLVKANNAFCDHGGFVFRTIRTRRCQPAQVMGTA
jgi:hypothetical protein